MEGRLHGHSSGKLKIGGGLKVVFIIARLNIGGPAINVVLLDRGLQSRGHACHLLAGPVPESEGDMEYYASDRDVAVTRIPELVRPLSARNDWAAFWKIYRFLRRERPDVVHTHTSKAGTLGRTAAILAGVPAIFHTFHGSVFDGYFSPMKTRLFLTVERFLARLTDRVITVSDSLRKQLSEVYAIAPPDKIEVVRLGFDLREFARVAESGRDWSERTGSAIPVVGWVGRLTEIKDPLLFVQLASALKADGTRARFVMVGDGELRHAVEAAVSDLGLSAEFTLAGWQRDMPRVYSEMDLIVSTSMNEGTPMTLIEAMATGCPFVAPNVGGVPDLTEGCPRIEGNLKTYANGILTNRRDVRTLQRAVSALVLDARLRKRMGRTGFAFALKNFVTERLIDETESLYVRFLQCKRAAPSRAGNSALTQYKEEGR
jgi:glycosyltransferase involved in cell wall biosynthesis